MTVDTNELLDRFKAGELGVQHAGRKLKSSPANMDLDDVVARLRAGAPFTVVLEPGDLTRYTITFLPLNASGIHHHGYERADPNLWMILRTDTQGFVGVVTDIRWDFAHHNVGRLARGSEHTANVLVAWISQVFSLLREEVGR